MQVYFLLVNIFDRIIQSVPEISLEPTGPSTNDPSTLAHLSQRICATNGMKWYVIELLEEVRKFPI
jgi:hypothetical protein